jgi:hypothetical protein
VKKFFLVAIGMVRIKRGLGIVNNNDDNDDDDDNNNNNKLITALSLMHIVSMQLMHSTIIIFVIKASWRNAIRK